MAESIKNNRRASKAITLGLLATMSALMVTGCDERGKQRRAQECLNGLRDRTSEQCREALARYPNGYASPLRSGYYGGGGFGWWHGGSGIRSGSGSSAVPGGADGSSAAGGSVSRGGFGDSAGGHGGGGE